MRVAAVHLPAVLHVGEGCQVPQRPHVEACDCASTGW